MRIVVDENIPGHTVAALRENGHLVTDVRGTARMGAADEDLWQIALRESALLVTTDKGFVRQTTHPHPGILVIRLRRPNREKIHQRVMQALQRFTETEWPGLIVVMRDRVQTVRRIKTIER